MDHPKSTLLISLCGLLFTLVLTSGEETSSGSCLVTVKDDFSGFYPMLFTEDGDFWPYEKSESAENHWNMEIANGQQMIVSCAPNYLRNFANKKTVKFSCNEGKLRNELGMEKKWRDVNCELRPVEEILATVPHCETPSHLGVEFGFVNPVTNKTLILGRACYSSDKGHTEFVQMRLKSATKTFAESALAIEPDTYFHRKQHPSGRYKIDMMKAWGDYVRTREDSAVNIWPKRFALPQSVHLSTLKKLAWNYAFSAESHETWSALQEEVMAMVEKRGTIVDYFAGSHGVMRLDGQEFYLGQENRFAVPEFLWMRIKMDTDGFAFVMYNKPEMSAEEETAFQSLCPSKCESVSWFSSEFKTKHGKYILCCTAEDVMKKIPEMPPFV